MFGTACEEGEIPGIHKAIYKPAREVSLDIHPYVKPLEQAVLEGQAAYRIAHTLQAEGFIPDVIYGHSGWGPTLFMKDLFPQAKLFCYFEWFYQAHGSNCDFDPNDPLNADDEARIRIRNAAILLDLYACDQGLSPTAWQRQQFPAEFHPKLQVRHDGVDTNFFRPNPGAKLVLPRIDLDLSHVEALITYVARGMEPYRGFPQFIEAIALVQQQHPHCHVVIVGEDRVAYGSPRPDGKTYKQHMLETVPLDLTRVHFTGNIPYSEHLQVLQASSVHVYLTYPFVLSWSFMEALSTGCLIVASDTPPVREVLEDGINGLFVDFFSPQSIAERIIEALDHLPQMANLRTQARQTILERYDLNQLLPEHIKWLNSEL